jgi:hypothetical protein
VIDHQPGRRRNDWFDDECKKKALETRSRARIKKANRETRSNVDDYNSRRKEAKRIFRMKKKGL